MITCSYLLSLIKEEKGGKKSLKLNREEKRRAFCLIFAKMKRQFFTLHAYISIYRRGMIETI